MDEISEGGCASVGAEEGWKIGARNMAALMKWEKSRMNGREGEEPPGTQIALEIHGAGGGGG